MKLRKSAALLAGAVVILAACQAATSSGSAAPAAGGGLDGALVKRSDIKIEVVTHGQAIDGFWGVVRNGVKAGASDMGVTVNYNAPAAESDMARHVRPHRRRGGEEAERPRRLDPEPGRPQPVDQEGRSTPASRSSR